MEKKISIQWLPTIILASIFILLTANMSMHAMAWTIVTSENDAGPGTLREAINMVNNGGSADPNAIAFAKNVKTIKLDSLLPHITEPVLIDGLAKVKNGTVVQEGDCSTIPSPVDDPCAFSCALRVTIDGSTIPITVSPDIRHGLSIDGDDITLRGLCITNITTPEPDSVAQGIVSLGRNTIECCEVKAIRNTAGTGPNSTGNYAAGIFGATRPLTINKTYIHNIQGGIISIECNNARGSDDQYSSGSAFGIGTRGAIQDTRVEEVKSGDIIACQPSSTSEEKIILIVGVAVGITTDIQDLLSPINTRTYKTAQRDCPLDSACSNSECGNPINSNIFFVRNSLVNTIIGGTITSNIPYSKITQNHVMGIGFTEDDRQFSINESCVSNIHTGKATSSGDNSELVRAGSRGIASLVDTNNISYIRCNSISNVTLDTLTVSGFNTKATTGFSHGISLEKTNADYFIICNTIFNVTGGRAIADGNCSELLPSSSLIANIPTGNVCAPVLPFSVAGLYIPSSNSIDIKNNKIDTITGIQHTIQTAGAKAITIGSAGISVNNQSGNITSIENNTVNSVFGPGLTAFTGTGKIQNLQGSVGIDANGFDISVTNNCVTQVHEGTAHLQNSSIVSHFTNASSFTLLKRLKSIESLYKNVALVDDAESFVPVVTAGIAVSGRDRTNGFEPIIVTLPLITIDGNNVTDIAGAIVPGGQNPLGSVGVGIFAQPSMEQFASIHAGSEPPTRSKHVPLFDACNNAKELLGIIATNTINSVNGGTNAPTYGIMVDGSQLFLQISNAGTNTDLLSLGLFNITKNIITNLNGNGSIKPFVLTTEQLNSLQNCCFEVNGTDESECDFKNSFIPLLPFEPTSGIYTLFGGCSTLSSNTITNVQDSKADARGITTAASSDIKVFDNMISYIKGFGIFVGGSTIDETLTTGSEFIVTDTLPSLRNKIYNNSIFDNSNKGIKLGLINWNYFLFARDFLNACRRKSVKFDQETTEDSLVTYGNHGQVAPCIKKITRNSNGRVTVDVTLTNSLKLTDFVIQFFKNSTDNVPHGEQFISSFTDPQFILQTNINGNASARFTFEPSECIESGDTISAHVTVQEGSPIQKEFLGDTSEFSTKTHNICLLPNFSQKPNKPSKPGFAFLVNRTPEENKGNKIETAKEKIANN